MRGRHRRISAVTRARPTPPSSGRRGKPQGRPSCLRPPSFRPYRRFSLNGGARPLPTLPGEIPTAKLMMYKMYMSRFAHPAPLHHPECGRLAVPAAWWWRVVKVVRGRRVDLGNQRTLETDTSRVFIKDIYRIRTNKKSA